MLRCTQRGAALEIASQRVGKRLESGFAANFVGTLGGQKMIHGTGVEHFILPRTQHIPPRISTVAKLKLRDSNLVATLSSSRLKFTMISRRDSSCDTATV